MRLQIARLRQRLFRTPWRARCLEMLDHSDRIRRRTLLVECEGKGPEGILLSKGTKASQVADDDRKAAILVLDLISTLSEREISFGDRHVYRGVLSVDGDSYRSIAEIALHELHENEWLDYDELQERPERIDEAVKEAG